MAPPPPPPRELIDDVIPNILLRLPPDEPKCLFRAALVCKPWLRTISDPAFLRRYRAFHGAPPLLGLVDRDGPLNHRVPRFVATTEVPAFSVPIPVTDTLSPWADSFSASPLDCRHGRALLRMHEYGREYYLVSDPVFRDPVWGNRRRVPGLYETGWMVPDAAAAVFCAVTGCQHLDCHGSPFYVVLMFRSSLSATMSATLYSSRKGTWSKPASLGVGILAPEEGILALEEGILAPEEGIHDNNNNYKAYGRGALVGDAIYFMLSVSGDAGIIKYDWVKNCLSVVNPPPLAAAYNGQVTLMLMEDSSLGLAGIEHTSLHLWSRRMSSEEWVPCRVIDLEKMMPMANPRDRAQVVGFAEGVGVIFITTAVGLFMMGLKSGRVKKIGKPNRNFNVLPYMSFYTPGGGRFLQLARSH